jgi:histidyl-tRNA synthetase
LTEWLITRGWNEVAEQIKAVRGTRDVIPDEVHKWHYLEETARSVFEKFGFREVRTPVFEHTELFIKGTGEVTDIVQKEMYTFEDKGGRSLTLRPEGTPPVVRAYLEHSLFSDLPVCKLYYIAPMFRYERPQAGRYRQHIQLGAEIIGTASPMADAELMSMYMHFLSKINLEGATLKLNSVGCMKCRREYVQILRTFAFENIDSLCDTCKDRLDRNTFRMLDCKVEQCHKLFLRGPKIIDYLCDDCRIHFEAVKGFLDKLELPYTVSPFLVRGLDYYTRTVFEVVAEGLGAQDAIVGGGRYDDLVEQLGGKPTPALGFGSGLDRLIATMEAQNIRFPNPPIIEVYLASIGDEALTRSLEIAYLLRRKGISAEVDMESRSLRSQMKTANKLDAKYVIMVGEDEIEKGVVTLRDMRDGQQETVDAQMVSSRIEDKLSNSKQTRHRES